MKGHHALAFNLAFGSSGIGYSGYEAYADHPLNIVGKQTGMDSIGDLNSIVDGKWHHVVFDLAFAVKTRFNAAPNEITKAFLSVFDRQGSLNIFSNAASEPVPKTIDLRDMVLRSPQPGEAYFNDLVLSTESSPAGQSPRGEREYLVVGSIASRRAMEDPLVAIIGGSGGPSQSLGESRGAKTSPS